jgi:hypoxanthine-guanine phosphoribosyltransferase
MGDQDFQVPDFMEKREINRMLYSEADIKKRCKELGAEISAAYKGKLSKPLIVICTLKGAAVFFAVIDGRLFLRSHRLGVFADD